MNKKQNTDDTSNDFFKKLEGMNLEQYHTFIKDETEKALQKGAEIESKLFGPDREELTVEDKLNLITQLLETKKTRMQILEVEHFMLSKQIEIHEKDIFNYTEFLKIQEEMKPEKDEMESEEFARWVLSVHEKMDERGVFQ